MMFSFLEGVALAGLAYLVGQWLTGQLPLLQRYHVPRPLVGGLLFAVIFWLFNLHIPTVGYNVDFLVALLTTNMGLHITPKVMREGYKLLLLFVGFGTLLYFLQIAAVLPVSLFDDHPLHTAILAGPLSFVGAPFNLNPPDQTAPLEAAFQNAYPDLTAVAQGTMMLGVLSTPLLVVLIGRLLVQQSGQRSPEQSAREKQPDMPLTTFAHESILLVVLIISLVAISFSFQRELLQAFPTMKADYFPVILLAYLLGGILRLGFELTPHTCQFPEKTLTVVLLGPTMSIVLTYAIMSIPLRNLRLLTPPLVLGALLALICSALVARLAFPVFACYTDRYYAAVIATALLAVTTGWGPIAMSFLQRYVEEEGPVEPMPVIMPLNAFYLFPWIVILLSQGILAVFS